jgi:ppGpp synthetase/RelA/SpoT-type nucleotidyltranferase
VREYSYIEAPKESGYRGTHLVYRYYSDRSATWNGLSIEIQVRSRLQHA